MQCVIQLTHDMFDIQFEWREKCQDGEIQCYMFDWTPSSLLESPYATPLSIEFIGFTLPVSREQHLGMVTESVEHWSRVREIVGSDPQSSETNDV